VQVNVIKQVRFEQVITPRLRNFSRKKQNWFMR